MKNFAERLKAARGLKTQAEVAKDLGIKQPAYARYEKGEVLPGAEMLYKICLILGVSADWLLGLSTTTDRAVSAERQLVRINKALGHILKGTNELQSIIEDGAKGK